MRHETLAVAQCMGMRHILQGSCVACAWLMCWLCIVEHHKHLLPHVLTLPTFVPPVLTDVLTMLPHLRTLSTFPHFLAGLHSLLCCMPLPSHLMFLLSLPFTLPTLHILIRPCLNTLPPSPPLPQHRVWGLGFRVWGLGFRVWG